jgi:basic membrane lipoprotein Med (substrate-binding protein (PBP1-ABC) superfamily)
VIALPPDPGLANLAASAPGTQFLAVGISGLNSSGNLSVIASDGTRPDQLGFLAGYIAAVITDDWRVGVISSGDTLAGKAAQQSFMNGAVYFCGLCRPAHPPFYQYPLFAELPVGASQADQQGAADYMIDHAAKTVYVAAGAGDDFLLEYLAKADIHIIGNQTPPAGVVDHWVASVHTDLLAAVQGALPKLMNDEGGLDLKMPLVISDQNEALFSPGRQNLVKETLDNLEAGYIDTGVDPKTGETR